MTESDICFKRLTGKDLRAGGAAPAEWSAAAEFVRDQDRYIFVGTQHGEPVAWLYGYGMLRPDGRRMFFIYSVDVLESCRGRGIGTKLIRFVLDTLRSEGRYSKYFVLADPDNMPARGVYRKFADEAAQVLYSGAVPPASAQPEEEVAVIKEDPS